MDLVALENLALAPTLEEADDEAFSVLAFEPMAQNLPWPVREAALSLRCADACRALDGLGHIQCGQQSRGQLGELLETDECFD